ncbi:hypothetical protein MASR2M44_25630 [Bacteroidota bacterium]
MKTALLTFLLSLFLVFQGIAQSPQHKTGGVCFRVDDHQGASKWRDWNKLFNKHGLKFSLAINASRLFNDSAAVNALREIVASGHELMDHTPDHHMGFFTVRSLADTMAFSGRPEVDHINGTKVCLRVDPPHTTFFNGEGLVNLIGNRLISVGNGEFAGINGNPYYALVYLPTRNQYAVYTSVSNRVSSDPDTLVLQTYWQETWRNDTAYGIPYERVRTEDVNSNVQSNILLAKRSRDLFALYGLPAPKTWIQPGGNYALLNRFDVQDFAIASGYTAGAVNIQSSQKCYNEVDSFANRRFALQGPDFYEESANFQTLTNIISDRSARHYQSFGLSHMNNVQGGWTVFLGRVDSVLTWLNQHSIPVRTYNQWASILFDSIPLQGVNTIPSLEKDLNNNGLPDGYTINSTAFSALDGFPGKPKGAVFGSANNQNLASISNLGGLEKGTNLLRMYTKGQPGDSIRMIFSFPEISIPSRLVMFGAGTPDWTLQTRTIDIPQNITRVNVSWVLIKRNIPGTAAFTFPEMRKSAVPTIQKNYSDTIRSTGQFNPVPLYNLIADGYFGPQDWTISIASDSELVAGFDTETGLLSVQKSKPFWVGEAKIKVVVSNPDNLADTAYLNFSSRNWEMQAGDTLDIAVALGAEYALNSWSFSPSPTWFSYASDTLKISTQSDTWVKFNGSKNGVAYLDSFFVKVWGSVSNPVDSDSTVTPPSPSTGNFDFSQKLAGVNFRFDDYQSPANLRAINNLFNSHQLRFNYGLNASRLLSDTAYRNAVREIWLAGHELSDHTPDHSTIFFNLNANADTLQFVGHPGVDHFNGKKVCLKIDSVATSTWVGEGLVNIIGSTLISQAPGEFRQMNGSVYYSNIYVPALDRVFTYSNLRNLNVSDPDTMTIQTVWGETVNYPSLTGLTHERVTQYDVFLTEDAWQLLRQRTVQICQSFGIDAPLSFFMPTGNYPMLRPDLFSSGPGLVGPLASGAAYAGNSAKVYNEFNPTGSRKFGLHGGDFKDEQNSAASIAGIIADNAAKHQCSFSQSHFSNLTGGITGYISRLDTLLTWCKQNGIPVLTNQQWAAVLYDSIANPLVNIFPMLQVDKNRNGFPDGYSTPWAVFDTTDGVAFSGNRNWQRTSNGIITNVNGLGGLEKGANTFKISTKGFAGDSVRLVISYPEGGFASQTLMIPANTSNWQEYELVITIPVSVSRINLAFNAAKRSVPGPIKISGIQMYAQQALLKQGQAINTKEELHQNKEEGRLLIYPNPGTDYLVLKPEWDELEFAQVYNGRGTLVKTLLPNSENLYLVNELQEGIYIIRYKLASGATGNKRWVKLGN